MSHMMYYKMNANDMNLTQDGRDIVSREQNMNTMCQSFCYWIESTQINSRKVLKYYTK